MPGSFFSRDRHSGFYYRSSAIEWDSKDSSVQPGRYCKGHTLLASFRCFRCFAAPAFAILCLSLTGVRFDFCSVHCDQDGMFSKRIKQTYLF